MNMFSAVIRRIFYFATFSEASQIIKYNEHFNILCTIEAMHTFLGTHILMMVGLQKYPHNIIFCVRREA
jgi:hypothetical protein